MCMCLYLCVLYDYIHFLSEDQENEPLHVIGLDYESDFYNPPHVNYYGAEKFTAYYGSREAYEAIKSWDDIRPLINGRTDENKDS